MILDLSSENSACIVWLLGNGLIAYSLISSPTIRTFTRSIELTCPTIKQKNSEGIVFFCDLRYFRISELPLLEYYVSLVISRYPVGIYLCGLYGNEPAFSEVNINYWLRDVNRFADHFEWIVPNDDLIFDRFFVCREIGQWMHYREDICFEKRHHEFRTALIIWLQNLDSWFQRRDTTRCRPFERKCRSRDLLTHSTSARFGSKIFHWWKGVSRGALAFRKLSGCLQRIGTLLKGPIRFAD